MVTTIFLPPTSSALESRFEITDQSSWKLPLERRYTTYEAGVRAGTIIEYQCRCGGVTKGPLVQITACVLTITVTGTGEATVTVSGALIHQGKITMVPASVKYSTDRSATRPCHISTAPSWVQAELESLGVIA